MEEAEEKASCQGEDPSEAGLVLCPEASLARADSLGEESEVIGYEEGSPLGAETEMALAMGGPNGEEVDGAWHRRSHLGERPFACSLCGRRFARRPDLARHYVTHAEGSVRPHRCGECGRRFVEPAELERHRATHRGERPYGCSFCGKSFAEAATLARHRRSHLPTSVHLEGTGLGKAGLQESSKGHGKAPCCECPTPAHRNSCAFGIRGGGTLARGAMSKESECIFSNCTAECLSSKWA
uniref:C2H2-type domain-containing protein n=1 Tax=Varanus komodoensis TaxID=61221 RepID=A0A8D2IU61_VARKO